MLSSDHSITTSMNMNFEQTPGDTEGQESLASKESGTPWIIASPPQWTWIWANSRRYWRTGESGIQRVGHALVTEQQQRHWLHPVLGFLNNNETINNDNDGNDSGQHAYDTICQALVLRALSIRDLSSPI